MKLTPPKQIVFLISIILIAVGIIGHFVAALGAYSFWALAIGSVLLALSCMLKGL